MAHVEYFGDLDGVARAKSELVTALPPSGVAVLNFDDPLVARMASVSPCPVLGYGGGGKRRGAGGARRARHRLATAVPVVDAMGCRRRQARVARDPAGSERARSRGHSVVVRSPSRGRGVRLGDRHRVAPSHGGASRSRWTRPGRGLLQRQPGLDRGGAAFDGRRCRQCAGWRFSGSWPSWGPRPRPSIGGSPGWPRSLGIEVVGYQTGLYGAAEVTTADDAVALLRALGPGDAALVKGSRVARLEEVVRRLRGGHRRSVPGDRRVARRRAVRPGGTDEDPAGKLAVEGLGARRRRASRVEGVDPALAVAPFEAEPVRVALCCRQLHGGSRQRLAVGLDDARLLDTPAPEIEEPGIGRQRGQTDRPRRPAPRRCAQPGLRASHHA